MVVRMVVRMVVSATAAARAGALETSGLTRRRRFSERNTPSVVAEPDLIVLRAQLDA